MSCHREPRVPSRNQDERAEPAWSPTDRTRLADPGLRAGDADRDRVNALLSEALAAGYLTMTEFDERSDRVLGARTMGELDAEQKDLPVAVYADQRPAVRPEQRTGDDDPAGARRGLRAHLGSYLGVMALLVGIWLVAGLTAGAWYFWPIWPMLGWGVGIASHAIPVLAGTRPSCGPARRLPAR